MMGGILIYAFAAATLGGITSPFGAVVGGFLVGVIENLAGTYLPFIGTELKLTWRSSSSWSCCSSGRAASSATPSCGGSDMPRGRTVGLGVLLLVALLLPFLVSGFRLFQFTQVCVYAMVLLGLNLLTGYNGQISLGHGAFYALGAYTMAIMIDRWGVGYGWTIPAAGLVCFLFGFFFGFRHSGWRGSTWRWRPSPGAGGAPDPEVLRRLDGRLPGHRALEAAGAPRASLSRDQWLYYLALAVLLGLVLLTGNLLRSRPAGRSWRSATTRSPPGRWASTPRSTSR